MIEELQRRLRAKGDCLEWQGQMVNTGYGTVRVLAHRLSYMTSKGPIPKGLFVLHSCDNRLCVNPDHLFLGTNSDNVKDAYAKGKISNKGENNKRWAKLNYSKVREIRRRSAQGETRKALALEFGIKPCTISNIVADRVWNYKEAYPCEW